MRFGIISEGKSEQTVIRNILRSYGFETQDIHDILPRDQVDETDFDATIGTFQGVKNVCEGGGRRPVFIKAFDILRVDYMVIHLDTAEIDKHDFRPIRPPKDKNCLKHYSTVLRERVISLIDGWLENNYKDQLLYAIAIEEIEAWVLTIFEKRIGADTSQSPNPKEQLRLKLQKSNEYTSLKQASEFFNRKRNLEKCLPFNQSLKDFKCSLDLKIPTQGNDSIEN